MPTQVSQDLDIAQLVQKQRDFFASEQTKALAFRKKQLQKLYDLFQAEEQNILEALRQDLGKHEFEAYMTELGFVMVELQQTIKNLNRWAKPKKVSTPLFHFKASSYIYPEPYGNVLVIAPWNYPFQLLFAPVIGALAAGNTVVLKPSEFAPNMAAWCEKHINQHFDQGLMRVVSGGIPETQALLEEKFDYIFFTGGTAVGKIIYQAAAKHLTPVTLELGGKSPCIVDKDTDLNTTAKRIAWGKFVNVGQTCVAPDYLLVDRKIYRPLVEKIQAYIEQFYGSDAEASPYYGRIVHDKHWQRLHGYLQGGKVIYGGQHKRENRYFGPTLMAEVDLEHPLMTEEIFGPILPILVYDTQSQALDFVRQRPKPLALYVFSQNEKFVERTLAQTSAGGVTVNDILVHLANSDLPFGGVGDSGIGAYHGQSSFDLFSHQKSVLKRSFLIDDPVRYAPYKLNIKWLRRLMDWTL